MALPIFTLYLEKVYANEKLGYLPGKFPEPSVPITKKYICVPGGGGAVSVRREKPAAPDPAAPVPDEGSEFDAPTEAPTRRDSTGRK